MVEKREKAKGYNPTECPGPPQPYLRKRAPPKPRCSKQLTD